MYGRRAFAFIGGAESMFAKFLISEKDRHYGFWELAGDSFCAQNKIDFQSIM